MNIKNLKMILSSALVAIVVCTNANPLSVRAEENVSINNRVEITYDNVADLNLQEQVPEEVTDFVESSSQDFKLDKKIDIEENIDDIRPLSRTRSIADGAITDYITTAGGYAMYWIDLPGGYYLQAQLDLPNNASLDYDLYLLDSQGYILDGPEYYTNINGASGTLSESAGCLTTTEQTSRYYLYVQSAVGASINESFVLKYSVSTADEYDLYEIDENAASALPFTFGINGAQIDFRNINSFIDNDWYVFTVPGNREYDRLKITVSTESSNTCGVEIYTNVGSNGTYKMEKKSLSNGQVTVGTGTYYVRVYNTAANFNSNAIDTYNLTILPILNATNIAVTDLNGTEGLNKMVNYSGYGSRFRTGTGNLTIMGVVYASINGENYPVANTSITGWYWNQQWEDNNTAANANRYATTVSDANGRFSVVIALPPGVGGYMYDGGTSYHYFDNCFAAAYVTNQQSLMDYKPVWHLAYTMWHG